MKILFDLTSAQISALAKYHGAAEYSFLVLQKLLALCPSKELGVVQVGADPVDSKIHTLLKSHSVVITKVSSLSELQTLVEQKQPDTFFSHMSPEYASVNFGKTRVVCVTHGLRSFDVPYDTNELIYDASLRTRLIYFKKKLLAPLEHNRRVREYKKLFQVVDTLVVSSTYTKNVVQKHFPELFKKNGFSIEVLYPPSTSTDAPPATMPPVYGVHDGEYFLITSASRWVKNAYRALTALDTLYATNTISQKTIVLGTVNSAVFSRRLKHPEMFIFGDYVSESELKTLYAHAYAYIHPSLSEGFGYAPLEAMRYGTPVICSNTTSLPEVCGPAAIYVDPSSIESIEGGILRIANDTGIRKDRAEKSRVQFSAISKKQETDLEALCALLLKKGGAVPQ